MAELLVIRHAQASFGADNYDQLSDLGYRQGALLGALLRDRGWVPDRCVIGALKRQRQTLDAMEFDSPETQPGFDEYNFHDLLSHRFDGALPTEVMQDRKTHFRTLRETLRLWQQDRLEGVAETWSTFSSRVADALAMATRPGADRVLVVSSGGPIGWMVAATLAAPEEMMIALNLQVKNTSMTRFIFNDRVRYLHEFNATPHLDTPEHAAKITYS
ncbi:MAG: histidine phosphatase family protein [Pseudomonadota bacterium]